MGAVALYGSYSCLPPLPLSASGSGARTAVRDEFRSRRFGKNKIAVLSLGTQAHEISNLSFSLRVNIL